MLEPVDVVWQVLRVQSRVVMLHVAVILDLVDHARAEEFFALIVSPIRVRIVAEEVRAHLGVEISDQLLGLLELLHAVVVLGKTVRVLVEHSGILHVLVIKTSCLLKILAISDEGGHGHSDNKFHF